MSNEETQPGVAETLEEDTDLDEVKTPTKPVPVVAETAAERRKRELREAVAAGVYEAQRALIIEQRFEEEKRQREEAEALAAEALEDEEDEVLSPETFDESKPLYSSRPHWMQASKFWGTIVILPMVLIVGTVLWFVGRRFLQNLPAELTAVDGSMAIVIVGLAIAAFFYTLSNSNKQASAKGEDKALEGFIKWFKQRIVVNELGVRRRFRTKGFIWNMVGSFEDFDALVRHTKVTNCRVTQDGLGKLFGYGSVTIDSFGDQDVNFIEIPYVKKPYELQKIIYRYSR